MKARIFFFNNGCLPLWGIFFMVLLFTACSPQKKLARSFMREGDPPQLLLLPPPPLQLNNVNRSLIEPLLAENPALNADSLLYFNSRFLQQVSDSVFYETFLNEFIVELELLGCRVYTSDSLGRFLSLQQAAWTLSLAQVELEEYLLPRIERDYFIEGEDSNVYYKHFVLNAVNLNYWIEVSRLNDSGFPVQMHFASQKVTDDLQGEFRRHLVSGNVHYEYRFREMQVADIYRMAKYQGRLYAGYLYDIFLNYHLQQTVLPLNEEREYWHYNRQRDRLEPAGEQRFELLNNL